MKIARIVNGAISEFDVAENIPSHKLSTIRPVVVEKPSLLDGQTYSGPEYVVEPTQVREVWSVRTATADEIRESRRAARAAAYPPVGDGLDALVKLVEANPDLTVPAAVRTYVDSCLAVKAEYPIPNA